MPKGQWPVLASDAYSSEIAVRASTPPSFTCLLELACGGLAADERDVPYARSRGATKFPIITMFFE